MTHFFYTLELPVTIRYAVLCTALGSTLCVAAPGYAAREELTETKADARVDAIVNDFFGPNTYPKAEIISRNAKYAVHQKGHYVAGGKSYPEHEVRSATEEKIIGVIVSDMKDEARALVKQSPYLTDTGRDEIVKHVGKQTETELNNIFNDSGCKNGYAKFMGTRRSLREKARGMISVYSIIS